MSKGGCKGKNQRKKKKKKANPVWGGKTRVDCFQGGKGVSEIEKFKRKFGVIVWGRSPGGRKPPG